MKNDSKKISTYLEMSCPELKALFTKVKCLQTIDQQILALIPAHLAPFCHVANIKEHTLILIATNAAVITQLRYLYHELLHQFSQIPALSMITHIEYKVHPSLQNPSTKPMMMAPSMPLLSTQTASILREMTASLTDPSLKAVMERIASREKK